MGLPVSSRLRSSGEFALVRKQGTTYPGKYLVLSVLKQDDADAPTRFGFITSKKVGSAVQRNRLRRQFREVARLHPLDNGYWVVTIVRWRAPQANYEELRQDWLRAAKRARLLVGKYGQSAQAGSGNQTQVKTQAQGSSANPIATEANPLSPP